MLDITKVNLFNDLIKFPKKNIFLILLILGFGEWFASDVIHLTGGSIGFLIVCFGGYFFLKNDKPKFHEPKDLDGWLNLCNEDLNFFKEIEENNNFEKQNHWEKRKFVVLGKKIMNQLNLYFEISSKKISLILILLKTFQNIILRRLFLMT